MTLPTDRESREREAFEAEIVKHRAHAWADRFSVSKFINDRNERTNEYCDSMVRGAWIGWNLARAESIAVPVEHIAFAADFMQGIVNGWKEQIPVSDIFQRHIDGLRAFLSTHSTDNQRENV